MIAPAPERWREAAAFVVAVIALAFAATCATGCGGAPRAVRTALDVTAHAIVATDEEVAARYTAAADRALEASATREEYRRRMATWDRLEASLRSTRVALLVAERSVDAWEAKEASARGALGCLADAVQLLADGLVEAAIPIPPKLLQVLALSSSVVGPCPEPAPPEVTP